MAYIGKNLVGVLKEGKTVKTMTGNGSLATLELDDIPGSVNNVLVFLDGVKQAPVTHYSVSGSTLTFTTAPEQDVVVTAIIGNHSGITPKDNSVSSSKIVDASVTDAKIAGISSSKLSGALPVIDGSSLTGVTAVVAIQKSASDPTVTTNPDAVGKVWANTTSGEMYVCTDNTTNANVWTNTGSGTGNIIPNVAPNEATDDMPDLSESSSTAHTFSGATDSDGTITHYIVDNISNSSLLAVTTAEVAAGSAHTFTTQSVAVDTVVTFRLRSKDNDGAYSTGITVSITVNNIVYTTATGGTITTDGNFKVHTFNTSSNFVVTTLGSDAVVDYLVIAGGAGGGNGVGGGGGAGGLRNSFNSETSGGGGTSETAKNISVTSYTVTIGAGGTASVNGSTSSLSGSGISTVSCTGGGTGGAFQGGAGTAGGSGGGGEVPGAGGAGTANEGYAGGEWLAGGGNSNGAGGGSAASIGGTPAAGAGALAVAGNGGIGLVSNIDGNGYYWAAGGGGAGHDGTGGHGGLGGGGGGSDFQKGFGTGGGSALNSGTNGSTGTNHTGGNAGTNTGSGGGGGSYSAGSGGLGGSGIVIIRYQFQAA